MKVDPELESKIIELRSLFGTDDPLVEKVVGQLEYLAEIMSLTKTETMSKEQVARLLTVAFWAGLGVDEGRPTRVRLFFAEPGVVQSAGALKTPVSYDAREITKLAAAVPPGGCLLVSPKAMSIWGVDTSTPSSLVNGLSVFLSTPGTLQLGIGPLQPYAVVSDGRATILADAALALPAELQRRLGKVGEDINLVWRECLVLAALARRILEQGHGGAILFVPDVDGSWSDSVEFAYKFDRPATILRDSVRREIDGESLRSSASMTVVSSPIADDLKHEILRAIPTYLPEWDRVTSAVAPLASVDGALVISRDLEIVGFGAKIVVSKDVATEIVIGGPQTGIQEIDLQPVEKTGGTRHQSAARFVGKNHAAVALVVSHDRHVCLLFWDDKLDHVVAVRNVDWWG